jgi:hypothetical protein
MMRNSGVANTSVASAGGVGGLYLAQMQNLAARRFSTAE